MQKIACQIKIKSAKCNPDRARKWEIPHVLNCSLVSSNDSLMHARLPRKSDEKNRNPLGESFTAKPLSNLCF